MRKTYTTLLSAIQQMPVVNTHAHQNPRIDGPDFDLDKLLRCSYTGWLNYTWDETKESREAFLSKVRYNSFFHWLEEGLKNLYGFNRHLTPEIWDDLSRQIQTDHQQPGHWSKILTERCRYRSIIQDSFWNPGDNNDNPDLYHPAFRINAFLFSCRLDSSDHNQNNALHLYNQAKDVACLDEYVNLIRKVIAEKQDQGCVALKLPIAYDRGLDFQEVSQQSAEQAFKRLKISANSEDMQIFQNYILFQICAIAAERRLPLQVHTGMGKLERSHAMWFEQVIRKNPATTFVLLHCSYPWIDDLLALMRTYANVYPDLAWLPQLGSYEARKMISAIVECGAAHKACWGCDTWTPEESLGSLLAFQTILSEALAEKVESSYLSISDAEWIAEHITSKNAEAIYSPACESM